MPQYFVKSPVFPFNKFPGVDPALGPEMRSTGEVMGVGVNFGEAFLKAQISAGSPLPEKGTVFISVNDRHKAEAVEVARCFAALGFKLVATRGTAAALRAAGLASQDGVQGERGPSQRGGPAEGRRRFNWPFTPPRGAPAFLDEKAIRRSGGDLPRPLHHDHERRHARRPMPSRRGSAIPCACGVCRKSTGRGRGHSSLLKNPKTAC